jgi:hypothetical protein
MNGNIKSEFRLDGPYLDILQLRQSGYCCSQIFVKLALRNLGRDNPDLVRATAALCYGTGYSGGTCGVLTGAACTLSLFSGIDTAQELAGDDLPGMLNELVEWFTAEAEKSYGGIRCEDILTASPDQSACLVLLVKMQEKVQSILDAAGFRSERGPS